MTQGRAALGRSFALTLALALAGCGGGEGELKPCNIAQHACQEDIYYAVLRLRGDGWDPFAGLPPIRTISVEQYRAELERGRAEAPPDTDEEPPPPKKPDPWGTALQILGLVTPTTSVAQASVDAQVDNVAAFYAPATRKVTVIDRGGHRDDVGDTILLSHELVHAFQDREVGARLSSLDTDGGFASRAFIEGEAVLYERLIAQEIRQRTLTRSDWQSYYGSWLTGLRMIMPEQRSPFFAAPWFVYPLGGGLLTQHWLEGGNAAVRRLAAAYPEHSVEYMAEASQLGLAVKAKSGRGCRPVASIDAFERVAADRFGAIQFYAFLARAGLPEDAAWRLALGWRDDELGVYFDPRSERTLVVWRVSFDDASAATSAAEQIAAARDAELQTLSVKSIGDGTLQIAGSDEPEWSPQDDAPLGCR